MHRELPSMKGEFATRAAAAVFVLAWFASIPGMFPMLLAAVSALDCQHRPEFKASGGQVALVLHHQSRTEASRHRHEIPAQVLAAFANPGSPQEDHVILLTQIGIAKAPAAIPPLTTPVTSAPPPPIAEVSSPIFCPIPLEEPAFAPRLSPASAFALICLRSTTLRI